MISTVIDQILEHAKEKGKVDSVQDNPVGKLQDVRKLFKKDKNFQKVLDMYEMFRKIENLRCERTGEFRKNVNLRVYYRGDEINIDLEKLKEYADDLENFISTSKQFLLK